MDIRIGQIDTSVEVVDEAALLSPAVLARIVAVIEARLEEKAAREALRAAETRIGGAR